MSKSLPSPPSSQSLPLPPWRLSSPPFPLILSFPSRPKIVSSSGAPHSQSSPFVPSQYLDMVPVPSLPERISAPGQRLLTQASALAHETPPSVGRFTVARIFLATSSECHTLQYN